MITVPLNTASDLLEWSNRVYVSGAVLTLASAAMVLYEKRSKNQGKALRWGLATEIVVIVAAFISLCGTVGAISFSNVVSHIKDIDLDTYKTSAGVQIANANAAAGTAKEKAESARVKAEEARQHAEAIRQSAEEARTKSIQAEADAQRAVLDKAKILNDNLKLQKQIEDERTARVEIEQRLAPRNIKKIAQDRMIEQLRPLLPQEVDIVIFTGNPEAQNLSSQLAYAFQAVNWKFYFYTPMGGSLQGVLIEYDPQDKQAAKTAGLISACLRDSGIQQSLVPNLPPFMQQIGAYTSGNGASGTAKVRIFVGAK